MAEKTDNQTIKVSLDARQAGRGLKDLTSGAFDLEAALKKVVDQLDQLAKSAPGTTAKIDIRGNPKSRDPLSALFPRGARVQGLRRYPTAGEAAEESDRVRKAAAKAQEAADAAAEKRSVGGRRSTREAGRVLSGLDDTIASAMARGRDVSQLQAQRTQLANLIGAAKAAGGKGSIVEDLRDASYAAKRAAQKEEKELLAEDKRISQEKADQAKAEKATAREAAREAARASRASGRAPGTMTALSRYGYLRAIDTGFREGGAALTGMITGGGDNFGAGIFGLIGAAGNTLHRYGMTRYATGRTISGAPSGGTASSSGGVAGSSGSGGGGGLGIGAVARGLGTAGGIMAIAGSGISALASAAIALHGKGAEQRSSATDYAFGFNRAIGRGFGSGFNRGGLPAGAQVDGISGRTSSELDAFRAARQDMYTTLAKAENGAMGRGEVNAKLGELTQAFGTRFSKLYGSADLQSVRAALTKTLITGHKYGLSAGTQGTYMLESLSALSGRGGGDMKEVLAAQRWGLNEDKYLQAGMSLRASAASVGITTNRSDMGDFALQLQRAGVDMTQAHNVPQALLSSAAGASKALTGAYGSLGQDAFMAKALSKTSSYEDAIEYSRNMTNQDRISALKDVLGETAARRYLMDAGLSKQTASNLLTGKSASGWTPEDLQEVTGAMSGLESFRARREAAQQPYESSQEREERMMRIDKLFDSIAAKVASFTDSLTKVFDITKMWTN